MPKKSKPTKEDLEAFHNAVKGTKKLISNKTRLASPTTKRSSICPSSPKKEVFNLTDNENLATVSGEEFISYKQASIPNKILRKLRKGQYNVDAILDLHGLTIEDARIAVDNFLHECTNIGFRMALIIHGKGTHSQMPILKNKLNQWLRQTGVVLAFCSAAPIHGSRGALYVLLKRAAEENSFE